MPNAPKLQRWTDLLAALLRYRYPQSFDVIRKEVPAYASHTGSRESLMRKFERDKDELRAFGVPIETMTDAEGNLSKYRLASKHFYLPFLRFVDDQRPPKRPQGLGYAGLPTLAFEPDEFAVIVGAARRVQKLGDASLAQAASVALRKIAHDIPVDEESHELVVGEPGLDGGLFDQLSAAVRKRKSVTFTYHSMARDTRAARHVDPYGIAYVNSNWYLIGRDRDADGIRQFRARRISDVALNQRAPQTPDFDVPPDFDLWAYTKSRQSWELGDAEARTVTVRFTEARGHNAHAMQLGEPVAGDPSVRGFRVRRVDSFLRWILSFDGAAKPVDPADVVRDYAALVHSTLALYE